MKLEDDPKVNNCLGGIEEQIKFKQTHFYRLDNLQTIVTEPKFNHYNNLARCVSECTLKFIVIILKRQEINLC